MNKGDINETILEYPNLLNSPHGKIIINNKEIGVLQLDNSIFEVRDFGGLLIALLNKIALKVERCPLCNHIHSDDGQFAFKPHRTHLCMYCGELFEVNEANVGNELNTIFTIPPLELKEKTIKIDDTLNLKYNVFKGQIYINDMEANKVIINNKEVSLQEYLNDALYNEY